MDELIYLSHESALGILLLTGLAMLIIGLWWGLYHIEKKVRRREHLSDALGKGHFEKEKKEEEDA